MAEITFSDHDGELIYYVDPIGIEHTGVVVGQSLDGAWYYVRSDKPGTSAARWHFKVSAEVLPGVIEQ